jgi:hypothetical protein
VYRLWPYREQYTDDLLCYLAGPGSSFADRTLFDPETVAIIMRVLQENTRLLATPEGRRSLMCEVVRQAVTRNYTALTESLPWRLQMALLATLGSTRSAEARKQIADALGDSQRRSRESLVVVLGQLLQVLGLRLRDPAYTLDHVQLAAGLLVQSMALRNVQVQAALGIVDDDARDGASLTAVPDQVVVNPLLNDPIPGPGLDGKPAEWTLVALSYLGVLDSFLELDPDFVPPQP